MSRASRLDRRSVDLRSAASRWRAGRKRSARGLFSAEHAGTRARGGAASRGLCNLLLVGLLMVLATPAFAQDTDPPVIQVLENGAAVADGALFDHAVTLTIEATDASPPVEVVATLDGAAFASGGTVSGEGVHQLAVTATDAVDNTEVLNLSFEIDTTPPAFVSVLPPAETVTAASEVTLSGEVVGAATLTIDGQSVPLVGGQFSAGPYALAEGARTFALVAVDAAGNDAALSHRIVRDSTAPAVAITQPAAGAVLGTTSVGVVGTVSDPYLAGVTVNGVAASVTGGTFAALAVPLAEGSNLLTAEATDSAGNSAAASRTVVLDTLPPSVAITDPAAGTVVPHPVLPVSGSAADPHLDRVEVDGVEAQLAGGSWSASVPLAEGPNTVVATAFDALGHSASDPVSVIRDSQAPAIAIVSPDDGSWLSAAEVTVAGTVEEEPGIEVTVNGVEAQVSAGAFTASGVALLEGENRLIARVTDAPGNQGAHTRIVYRDTVAPEYLAVDPAAGALAVPPDARFSLSFSEPLGDLPAGAWRLETAGGAALPAEATATGDRLTVQPTAPLPSATSIRLILTAALADRAGNPLSNPQTLGWTTADIEPPAAPTLAGTPPSPVCAARVALSGTAEPDSLIEATGGAGAVTARAAESAGAFALEVVLRPEALNRIELVAIDREGNASAPAAVEVVHDCTPPEVVGAELAAGAFTIDFSEPVAAASLAGAVSVTGASGAIAGTVAAAGGGWQAVFTPDDPLPSEPLRLEVSTTVADLAGNPLAYPFSALFGGAVTDSFVAGRVLDAATGRPLAGASVAVVASGGVPNAEPVPEQTTGEGGRFSIPVAPGGHLLAITRPGYTPALRFASAAAGIGADVFDPRLTPVAAAVTVGAGGGVAAGTGGAALDLPAGALAAAAPVSVTALDEQALPALLPYGWSPRGAVWIDLGGAALAAPADLTLPVEAPNGATLPVARLDEVTLQWRVEAEASVLGGAVTVAISEAGAWAAVEPDSGASAPPAPAVGAPLAAAAAPNPSLVTAAAIAFDPELVLPAQASAATVTYTLTGDLASGVPLTLHVREELTLLDGSVRRPAPYEADLVLYRAPDGTPRSRFRLVPSIEARSLPLEMGAEDVTLRPYGGETLQGGVIGPAGGAVTTPEGDRADLPAGALAEPSPVSLARRGEADLPSALPSAGEYLGALVLDLGGRTLALPAALTLELGAAPGAGEEGLLLASIDLPAGPGWRPVAQLAPTATGWTTAAIDPEDLPWPGVREGGVYAFARLTAPVGFLRGTVFGAGGAPLPGARVMQAIAAPPWVQLANPDGSYALPVPVGAVTALAENPLTLDRGLGAVEVPAAGDRVDLDLLIQTTGPALVAVDPADGATGVPPGIEPLLTFSEPVDPATLPGGVQLFDGANGVPIDLEASGASVRIVPQATLRPGALHEIRVSTAVKDFQGNRIAAAVTTTFTTQESTANTVLDPTRIHRFAPDGAGMVRVLGRPGAAPAGSLVFVENISRLASVPSVTAAGDGSFELWIEAALGDTLLLHVLPPNANEVIFELGGSLTPDGRGAHVPAGAATSFATLDGVLVEVEAGTFLAPAIVRVEPAPLTEVTAPIPSDFAYLAAFRLEVEGAEAQKALGLSLPTPAGAEGDEFLLARIERVLGEDYWMVHDLLRRDGDRLTNQPPPGEVGGSATAPAVGSGAGGAVGAPARMGSPASASAAAATVTSEAAAAAARGSIVGLAAPGESGGIRPLAAPARMGDRQEYLPGSANPGLYVVMSHTGFLDWVGIPLGGGVISSFAYFRHLQIEGMIAVVNQEILRLLERDAILIPTRRNQTYTLEGRDLATGFRFFEGTFDPPAPDEITVHPPDVFGDEEPPAPVSGSPVRYFVLTAAGGSHELAVGLSTSFAAGSLTVTGEPGAAAAEAQVRLVGLDDGADRTLAAEADGSFALTEPAVAGRRYVLALGAEVGVNQPLEIGFDEGLASSLAGISVRDAAGRSVAPQIAFASDTAHVRITPQGGWRAGEAYTLRLGPELADAAGNAWGETLAVEFTIGRSEVLDTLDLAEVRDVARLGSWLFVAAGADGLAVIDASDPDALRHLAVDGAGNGVTFPFPLADRAAAVAIDPHARVLVAGGGVTSFGQLKIFDPLAFDPVAVGQNPSDPAVRYAAFRGSTLVSDRLGGSGGGTSLPAGTPRRVTVLSDDQIDRWRLGVEPPPAGITLDPAAPPAEGGPYALTVAGAGVDAGLPVTLRDLDRGGFRRVDAGAGGAWSLTLTAAEGDRLELLRNRQSLAYLATLGVGIEVVDVNAFYGETPEDPENPSLESDVIGIYSGYQDPNLYLCNLPVSDLGASLIDLGTLFDAADPHPLTLVGLIGFRGVAMFESDAVDVGEVSFYNEACLEIAGSNRVSGMAVVEDYPFDLDGSGLVDPGEIRDYLVVTHLQAGVLILDATNRDELELVGWVRLPGQSGEVAVDRDRRLLYVSGLGGGIYVIDFDEAPSTAALDGNADGLDDRLLEVIPLAGNTNAATLMVPELGIAFAGGLDRGLTSIAVASPRLVALGPDGEGGWAPIARLAPLGVPTATIDGRELPATFRLAAALPGVLGAEVLLDAASLGPGGVPMPGAGDPASLPGLPPPALTGADGIVLRRLADQPWEDGYQTYVSDEVVTLADLRAARDYAETADEADLCPRCDGEEEDVPEEAPELLSGFSIAVRFPQSLREDLAGVYPPSVLDRAELSLASVPWEVSPAVRQEPALNPSLGTGDVAPGTLLHSGEYTHAVTDLAVRGRGLDVAFTRHYRNRTIGSGPLGPGWDLGYRVRLRELPNGDVEVYDARGRRELFVREGDRYASPAGVFAELARTAAGWVLLDAQRNLERFDRWGRRVAVADAVKDSADTGNELSFAYDLAGRLVRVTDDLGRVYSLAYDGSGRLESITDFTGRTVGYSYDADGRLETVTSPAVTIGLSTFPSGLTTAYAYESVPADDLDQALNARDNLSSLTDPRGVTWLELDYDDVDNDGRADEVTGQTWGGDPLSIVYDFTGRTATVTNRRGFATDYEFDAAGHTVEIEDAALRITAFEYDAEGNLTRQVDPLGTVTELSYATGGAPRGRGSLTLARTEPGAGGRNGSAALLTSPVVNDPRTNLPTRITDPRGSVTEIARNPGGLPVVIRTAAGSPDQAQMSLSYSPFGQPVTLTNDRGHTVGLDYATSGPAAGYLQRATADPGGRNLITRYEHDARGNVIATIDARGVRNEYDYNELDWLVEQRLAVTPSAAGAPALAYRTQYLYDAAGQVIELRRPFGIAGATVTRIWREYGALGELLREEREISAGETVAEVYTYDPHRNPVRVTNAEGETTDLAYDERDLRVRVERGGPGIVPPLVEQYGYDEERRLRAYTDPRGALHQVAYDGYQRPMEVLDPLGRRVQTGYDDGGNPVETRRLDEVGCLLAYTTTTYDLRGLPAEVIDYLWEYEPPHTPCEQLPPAARGLVTRLIHDGTGKLTAVIDPLDRQSTLLYDAVERLQQVTDPAGNVTAYTLDAAGNRVAEEVTEQLPGGGSETVEIAHVYDALNRRITTRDALDDEWQSIYDARGNLRLSIDPEGHVTERAYDGLDRLTSLTRPGGLRVELEYDASSRPVVYRDALGNETLWSYDDAGRVTAVQFEDGTSESWQYDPAGNPTRHSDARGNVIDQTFDLLGRLTGRQVTAAPGLVGPTSEAYLYDSLGRLVHAASGSQETERTYDSLSRPLGEMVAGRALARAFDDAGSPVGLGYSSSRVLGRALDELGRPAALGPIPSLPTDGASPAVPNPAAGFGYRGPGLLATRSVGLPGQPPAASASFGYDPARRLVSAVHRDPTTRALLDEAVAWTPRGLRQAQTRADRNGSSRSFTYDPAGRLIAAALAGGGITAGLPESWGFTLDTADNLLARTEESALGAATVELPLDGSGRNRPGSLDGVPLAWDASGNLIAKGDRTFHYDFRNRLTRVDGPGGELVSYAYDAFNRRVRRTAGGEVYETVWDGWQPIEEYKNGQLVERRTYGVVLDELLWVERDADGDGTLESSYFPIFDATGNVAMVVDGQGRPIEAYEYSPFGQRVIRVNDLTPPAVEQVRVVGNELRLELSEEVRLTAAEAAIAAGSLRLVEVATGQPVAVAASQPVGTGPRAGRRLVLTTDPAPAPATEVRLEIAAGSLVDLFGNAAATAAEATFAWTDGVAADTAAPEVLALTVADGRLRLTLSEEPDLASAATAIQIDGAAESWTLDADGYTLVSATVLDPGDHTVAAGTALLDLAGTPLTEHFSQTFSLAPGQGDETVYLAPPTDVVASSAAGNHRGFHGLEEDPATGLIYARNRWFDPELGRFASVDPMGYSDGPNLYQYGLNNPVNFSDPLGLDTCPDCREPDRQRRRFEREAERLRKEQKERGLEQNLILSGLRAQGYDVEEKGVPLSVAMEYAYQRYRRQGLGSTAAAERVGFVFGPGVCGDATCEVMKIVGRNAETTEFLANVVGTVATGYLFSSAGLFAYADDVAWWARPGATGLLDDAARGLDWSGVDAAGLSRAEHVLRHGSDIPTRFQHGVFYDDPIQAAERAWARRGSVSPRLEGDLDVWDIPMGETAGVMGGQVGQVAFIPTQTVRIVVEHGTAKVVTAYPIP